MYVRRDESTRPQSLNILNSAELLNGAAISLYRLFQQQLKTSETKDRGVKGERNAHARIASYSRVTNSAHVHINRDM